MTATADSATSAADKAAAEKCLEGYEELEAASEPHACEGFLDKDTTCPTGCAARLELLAEHCTAKLLGEDIMAHMAVCGVASAAAPTAAPTSAGVASNAMGVIMAAVFAVPLLI
jgi:hypothetical protein